jgi:hypothetical protein
MHAAVNRQTVPPDLQPAAAHSPRIYEDVAHRATGNSLFFWHQVFHHLLLLNSTSDNVVVTVSSIALGLLLLAGHLCLITILTPTRLATVT